MTAGRTAGGGTGITVHTIQSGRPNCKLKPERDALAMRGEQRRLTEHVAVLIGDVLEDFQHSLSGDHDLAFGVLVIDVLLPFARDLHARSAIDWLVLPASARLDLPLGFVHLILNIWI